jgi:hypothetical protein
MAKYKGYDIGRSDRKGKKYKACKDDKCVHFGASGYTIKPGSNAGDSYCARSAGIKNSGKDSANYWARQLWSCSGSKSASDKPFFGKIKLP